jgi:uncharacterized protein (DUF1800 family)
MTAVNTKKAIIAVNRFGLGASGNELSDARHDPEQWLLQQLVSPVFDPALGNTESAFNVISDIKAFKAKRRRNDGSGPTVGREIIMPYRQRFLKDSLAFSVNTNGPFAARLLDFFSNHFSVSSLTQSLTILSPTLERDAIAPNLFGKFEDLLIAVEQHPAMLIYLNNEKSVGPNSQVGRRARGLNENLAREILELHTLGVGGGYTLLDIRELAMAISGWSVNRENKKHKLGFQFRRPAHEPGVRKVLGKKYIDTGLEQGQDILRELARHKKTAEFVSYKLAQHLIADEPPQALVAAMTKTWIKTQGDIKAVVSTLVKHPQSWGVEAQKYKTPRELIVSAIRAVNDNKVTDQNLLKVSLRALTQMGHRSFASGSPAGYSQLNRDWTGSDALMKRIDWVNFISKRTDYSPQFIASRIFDSQLSPLTVKLIAGAESRAQGLALLFLCPKFQYR